MEHTKEPWVTYGNGIDGPVDQFGDKQIVAYQIESQHDNRRIVACVNACAGIPTEDLERWGTSLVTKIQEDEITTLRNELKEAQAEIEAGNLEIERLSYVAKETDTRLNDAMLQIERLNAENISFACNLRGKHATTGATYEILRTQLAASQARISELEMKLSASQANEAKLREALRKEQEYQWVNYKEVASWITAAISLPSDTAALEALIQKAGEVMRERCERVPDRVPIRVGNAGIWGVEVFKEIRALPGVTMEDLK